MQWRLRFFRPAYYCHSFIHSFIQKYVSKVGYASGTVPGTWNRPVLKNKIFYPLKACNLYRKFRYRTRNHNYKLNAIVAMKGEL